jgi:3-hydroxyacyl-CoA dehydrogenase
MRIGVIGAGVMGSGIAQTLATAGYATTCCDVSPDALQKAKEQVRSGRYGFDRAVERGKMSEEDAGAAMARLSFSESLTETAAADLVIECVPERLDLKLRVFRDLDAAAGPDTILASNSSGFSITALAAMTERADKVIGWHWASPPVIMPFAEIVVTPETAQDTVETVQEVARSCRKNPIVVNDAPMAWGYVANRVYFAMIREAQRVVDEGVASPEAVNQLMVDCYNWPVGPFAMIKGATDGWQ